MPGGCWTAGDGPCPSDVRRAASVESTSFPPIPTRSRTPNSGFKGEYGKPGENNSEL